MCLSNAFSMENPIVYHHHKALQATKVLGNCHHYIFLKKADFFEWRCTSTALVSTCIPRKTRNIYWLLSIYWLQEYIWQKGRNIPVYSTVGYRPNNTGFFLSYAWQKFGSAKQNTRKLYMVSPFTFRHIFQKKKVLGHLFETEIFLEWLEYVRGRLA